MGEIVTRDDLIRVLQLTEQELANIRGKYARLRKAIVNFIESREVIPQELIDALEEGDQ